MSTRFCTRLLIILLLNISVGNAAPGSEEFITFERQIRPILRAHCLDCHGAVEELQGNLDLRQVRLMQQGGDSGTAIQPGDAAGSLLLQRIQSGEMPPGEKKVSAEELQLLKSWIEQGARTARPEPEQIPPGLGLTPEDREFWAVQPVTKPDIPEISSPRSERIRTPIDAFLLSAMPEELSFAADADRATIVRRLYLDLIGLPASVADQQRWQSDSSEDWYDRLVEELLASEHYGERWARHWLDVAGYADSDGYTVADSERPWAWKYRDYVIRSFNHDKPFDQFITEQLAGDELVGPISGDADLTAEQIELLTATGFLRMAADGTGSGANNEVGRNQMINDTLRIVSSSLLGLSMGCAQCHDHRYDPILQTDYFALRAVFAPSLDWQQWKTPEERRISLYTAADRQQAAGIDAEANVIVAEKSAKQKEYMQQALEKELTRYEQPLRDRLRAAYDAAGDQRTDEQKSLLAMYPSVNISPGVLYQYLPAAAEDLKKYDARIAEVRGRKTTEEFLSVLTEPAGHLPETRLFHRGDPQQPKQVVLPAALLVACAEDAPVEFPENDPSIPTSGRRLAFSRWLTSRQNPLTARVLVNRFWLHHFGRGIVPTPSDFGKLGSQPTHPELLDWLASELMDHGFSVKHLHRVILSSTAWRQSTQRTPQHDQLDPDNRFYSRRSMIRLDAEVVRDQMLAVSGKLDAQLYGRPIPIKEDDAGQVIVDPGQTRRSLYVKVRRSQPVAMLQAFDAPVMETNCELRPVSTVATQSLMLMNSESVLELSQALAERCQQEPAGLSEHQLAELPILPQPPATTWQYGYGAFNEQSGRVELFHEFPHWTGTAWQGGAAVPDPELGYALLTAEGGHPDAPERSVIRRWIVPEDGVVRLSGSLSHSSSNGDGVRGRLVSSNSGLLGSWNAFNGKTETNAAAITVKKDETLDFMTDSLASITSDSFHWPVTITLSASDQQAKTYGAAVDFRGPIEGSGIMAGQVVRAWQLAYGRSPQKDELLRSLEFVVAQTQAIDETGVSLPKGRTAWQQAMISLCHALITSNEFLYVD